MAMRSLPAWGLVLGSLLSCPACGGRAGGEVVQAPAEPRAAAPRAAKPQATAEGARDYALSLIERGDYRELITRLVVPEQLAKVGEREGGLELVITEFAAGKAAGLTTLLRATVGHPPTFDENGTHATFTADGVEGAPASIRFRKVDSDWYIEN
jgi:hypothetical protein